MTKYIILIMIFWFGSNNFAQKWGCISKQDSAKSPTGYTIYPHYPNPFSETTYIRFDLPDTSKINLVILSETKDTIRLVYSGILPGGFFRADWGNMDSQGNVLPGGIYFIELTAESKQSSIIHMNFKGIIKWLILR